MDSTSDPSVVHLGRDTAANVRHFDHVVSTAGYLPRSMLGERPRKSPNNAAFWNRRYCAQLRGNCFPAGTMVRMADGSEKPIEGVKVGDRVVTRLSGSRRVVNVMSRDYSGEMITVRSATNPRAVTATADHRFAAPRGEAIVWRRLSQIQIGEELLASRCDPAVLEAALLNRIRLVLADRQSLPPELLFPRQIMPESDVVVLPARSIKRVPCPSVMERCLVLEKSRVTVTGLRVFDIEVEEDHSFVANGFVVHNCTGEAFANCVQALIRMPPDRSTDSKPLPRKDLSALYAYWEGRRYGIARGMNFGPGDGGVGSFVAFAGKVTGIASLESYPPTDLNYQQLSDSRPPPAAALQEGPQHKVVEAAIIPSFGAVLDHVGAGFVCMVGMPIPEGFTKTDKTGRFRWTGNEVGGHEFCVVDYDLDKGTITLGNSWSNARWGALENHPDQDPRCQGFNNMGWCPIEELEAWVNRYNSEPGAVEWLAVNTVVGWAPKLVSFSDAY